MSTTSQGSERGSSGADEASFAQTNVSCQAYRNGLQDEPIARAHVSVAKGRDASWHHQNHGAMQVPFSGGGASADAPFDASMLHGHRAYMPPPNQTASMYYVPTGQGYHEDHEHPKQNGPVPPSMYMSGPPMPLQQAYLRSSSDNGRQNVEARNVAAELESWSKDNHWQYRLPFASNSFLRRFANSIKQPPLNFHGMDPICWDALSPESKEEANALISPKLFINRWDKVKDFPTGAQMETSKCVGDIERLLQVAFPTLSPQDIKSHASILFPWTSKEKAKKNLLKELQADFKKNKYQQELGLASDEACDHLEKAVKQFGEDIKKHIGNYFEVEFWRIMQAAMKLQRDKVERAFSLYNFRPQIIQRELDETLDPETAYEIVNACRYFLFEETTDMMDLVGVVLQACRLQYNREVGKMAPTGLVQLLRKARLDFFQRRVYPYDSKTRAQKNKELVPTTTSGFRAAARSFFHPYAVPGIPEFARVEQVGAAINLLGSESQESTPLAAAARTTGTNAHVGLSASAAAAAANVMLWSTSSAQKTDAQRGRDVGKACAYQNRAGGEVAAGAASVAPKDVSRKQVPDDNNVAVDVLLDAAATNTGTCTNSTGTYGAGGRPDVPVRSELQGEGGNGSSTLVLPSADGDVASPPTTQTQHGPEGPPAKGSKDVHATAPPAQVCDVSSPESTCDAALPTQQACDVASPDQAPPPTQDTSGNNGNVCLPVLEVESSSDEEDQSDSDDSNQLRMLQKYLASKKKKQKKRKANKTKKQGQSKKTKKQGQVKKTKPLAPKTNQGGQRKKHGAAKSHARPDASCVPTPPPPKKGHGLTAPFLLCTAHDVTIRDVQPEPYTTHVAHYQKGSNFYLKDVGCAVCNIPPTKIASKFVYRCKECEHDWCVRNVKEQVPALYCQDCYSTTYKKLFEMEPKEGRSTSRRGQKPRSRMNM